MTKLNQIVAVEKGEKGRSHQEVTEVYKAIQKPLLFSGLSRVYRPKDDDGDQLPPESQEVQCTARSAISDFREACSRLIDVTATKDFGNCHAKADVVVRGQTIVEDAPVSFLLFLEKKLIDVRTFIGKLPTLDPAQKWELDTNTGLYKTDVQSTTRTRKELRNHVKYEATDKHPAQVETYTEDVIVGYWDKVQFSGGITNQQKTAYLDKVDDLLKAIKFAREEANMTEVEDKEVSQNIFGYLFA